MAELDNSALINDLLSGLLLEEVEQNAPVEPKGLMSSKTGTNTSADAAAAEAELQPKSGRASITEFIQKLSAADTPNEGESGGTLGSVNYLTMDDMYRKYNTPLYKLGSLNRDTGSDEDAAALKVKRNTNFGDAYLDSLGAAMDKSDTNSKRESILSEGKASTLFDRKAAEDLASTFLEGLQDKYQEKRINPNVKSFPEQDSVAVTELDDAAVGGTPDGKVGEGLMSSNASDDPSEESTFGESLMSRPPYDKEAMLDINEPEGEGNPIFKAGELDITENNQFSINALTNAVNSISDNPWFSALILGTNRMETSGDGLITEKTGYTKKRAYEMFKDSHVNAALASLPKAEQNKINQGAASNALGTATMDIAYDGGSDYRGRGLVQLTGRENYKEVQNHLAGIGINVDLVGNPSLVNDPRYALPVMLSFFERREAGSKNKINRQNAKEMGPYKLARLINAGEISKDGKSGEIGVNNRWNAFSSYLQGVDLADANFSNEKDAQRTAGITGNYTRGSNKGKSKIDGNIGPASIAAFKRYLKSESITIPKGATPYDLVRLVNGAPA